MTWLNVRPIASMTVQQFAESHGLVVVVDERPVDVGNPSRFYARFEHSDVKGDGVLIGTFGNGATIDAAIAEYANEITYRTLVIDAGRETRREISVPRLRHPYETNDS